MNFSSSSAAASNDGINNSFQRISVTQIAPTDIKKNIWTLKKAFKSVSLTRNSCLKPQHVPGSFGHFEQGVPLCEIFTDIGQKFFDRSKIVLAKECLVRLESSAKFVKELEETVEKYMAYLDGEMPIPSEFPFKVERFHDICHAAKTKCMYRLAIRKLIFSDPWLRKCVPDMLEDLEVVNKALSQLADTSISLISIILSCVLRLAEKCKWWLSQQGLSAVCQGIEDFNRLFEYTRNFQSDERELLSVSEIRNFVQSKGRETAVSTTAVSSVCLLSLNKLLNGVACERSRILAGHVYELVSEHQEVTRTLKYDFATNFEWKDFGVVCTGGNVRLEGGTLKNGVLSVLSRNQIPLLKLEPDSPLLSFDSEEQKFFSNLISQLATSTTLILSCHVSGERKNVIQLPPLEQLTSSSRSEDADLQGTSTAEEAGGSTSSLLHHQEGHGILRHSSSPGSPRLNKRVQWNAPLDSETTKQLHYDYSTMLWASFGEQLVALMAENQESIGNLMQNVALGPLFLWSDFLLMVVVRMMESLRLSGCLPPAGTSSLQAVSCYLHCLASASSWDSAFSGVLGSCLSDKCRMDSELTDSIPGTQTAQSIVSLLDPLESIFEMAGYWKRSSSHLEPHANRSARALTLSVFPSLCRFHSLLSFGFNWFDTKIHHFLSLWSLEQFLLLTQWDLPLFLQSVKKTFFLVQSLSAVHSDSISWNSLSVQYSLLQEQRSNLEGLLKKSWVLFSRDLTKISTEFFQEAMPVGKSWKKSRHSGIPHQRSQYVEHAVFQILEPVVESSMGLPFESRLNVLTLVVNTMMESWSDFILKEEIVFSFYGAQQLSLDFGYIKVWIASDSSNLSSEIQSHLLKLDVFRHLDGAIGLLMLQPRKKKSTVEDNDGEFESNASTMSSSSVLSSLSGVDIDAYDIDVLNDKTIPNRQKWLDLRLRGGKSKKGLLPFCLKVQEMK